MPALIFQQTEIANSYPYSDALNIANVGSASTLNDDLNYIRSVIKATHGGPTWNSPPSLIDWSKINVTAAQLISTLGYTPANGGAIDLWKELLDPNNDAIIDDDRINLTLAKITSTLGYTPADQNELTTINNNISAIQTTLNSILTGGLVNWSSINVPVNFGTLTATDGTTPITGINTLLLPANSFSSPSSGVLQLSLGINQLVGVSLTAPTFNHVIYYDGTRWSNKALSLSDFSDFSVTSPATGQTLRYISGVGWTNYSFQFSDLVGLSFSFLSAGDYLYYDGSTWTNRNGLENYLGYISNASFNETPDGTEDEFTINDVARSGSISVFKNGLLLQPAVDYAVTYPTGGGTQITFTTAPLATDILRISYVYDNSFTIYVASELVNEIPDGTITSFTVDNQIRNNSESVYVNGLLRIRTVDYTVSGNTITFATAPTVSSVIQVTYLKT